MINRRLALGTCFVGLLAESPRARAAEISEMPNIYVAAYQADIRAAAGKAATAIVSLVTQGDYKINRQYPFRLKLTAPAGVTLAKTLVTLADARRLTDTAVELPVTLIAAKAGSYSVASTLYLSVTSSGGNTVMNRADFLLVQTVK